MKEGERRGGAAVLYSKQTNRRRAGNLHVFALCRIVLYFAWPHLVSHIVSHGVVVWFRMLSSCFTLLHIVAHGFTWSLSRNLEH